MTQVVQLREIVQSPSVVVDRETGVIRGVKILGAESLNGRRYTHQAMHKARELYEGIQVNFDHPPRRDPRAERSISDRAGWLENVSQEADGLTGDLNFLKSDPRSEKICEAAERRPSLFGLSHNAEGRIRKQNGTTLVEEITRVRSVDIVGDPATTRSLFESENKGGATMPKTVQEIVAALPDSKDARIFRRLLEQETPIAAAAEVPVEVAPEADSGEQLKAAFRAAIIAAFDDESLDMKATLARMKEILTSYEKLTEPKEPSEPVVPESPAEAAATESLRRELRELKGSIEAYRLLESAGITADQTKVKSLAALSDADDRRELLKTWRQAPGKPGSVPLGEADKDELPKDGKELAEWLQD